MKKLTLFFVTLFVCQFSWCQSIQAIFNQPVVAYPISANKTVNLRFRLLDALGLPFDLNTSSTCSGIYKSTLVWTISKSTNGLNLTGFLPVTGFPNEISIDITSSTQFIPHSFTIVASESNGLTCFNRIASFDVTVTTLDNASLGGIQNAMSQTNMQLVPSDWASLHPNEQYQVPLDWSGNYGMYNFNYGSAGANMTTKQVTAKTSPPFNKIDATTVNYKISNGWGYVYTSSNINNIKVLPPPPTFFNWKGQRLFIGSPTDFALLDAKGFSQNGLTARCAHYLHCNYVQNNLPDNYYFSFWARMEKIVFSNPNIASMTAGGNGGGGNTNLAVNPEIRLDGTISSDHPELMELDWYVKDVYGEEQLVAENVNHIDARVPGKYFCKMNLKKEATVNAETGEPEEYTGDKFYIDQSEEITVYNSSSATPTITSLSISPNPTCQTATIHYGLSGNVTATHLTITDGLGAVKYQDDLFVDQQTKDMDIPGLNDGIYLVSLTINGSTTTSTTMVVDCP
jgi:hypothetical protein